ncbi:Synaptic vesicle glycoprotein 2A [Balamuthia mandrillaris]
MKGGGEEVDEGTLPSVAPLSPTIPASLQEMEKESLLGNPTEHDDKIGVAAGQEGDGEDEEDCFDKELERIGTGWFQYLAMSILGLGNAADAVELLAIGYILPELPSVSGTEKCQSTFLSAAVFMGMLVGGVACGLGSDRFGRKPCLLVCLFTNFLFGFLSAFAPNASTLIGFRVLSGVGVGGSVPSVFTMAAEFLCAARRGFWVTYVAWWWMVGSIFAASAAWIMIGVWDLSWRYFAAVAAMPSLLCFLLCLFFVPETPRFLYTKRHFDKTLKVLSFMSKLNGQGTQLRITAEALAAAANQMDYQEGEKEDEGGRRQEPSFLSLAEHEESNYALYEREENDDDSMNYRKKKRLATSDSSSNVVISGDEEDIPPRSIKEAARRAEVKILSPILARSQSIMQLFHPSIARTTVLQMIIWFTLSFGWYGLILWIPSLFEKSGFDVNIYQDAFLVAAANLPGNIASALLMDRLGRKMILFLSMAIAACLAVGFAFSHNPIATVTIACAFNAISVGGWNALDCLSAESFPTALRTFAMGLLSACGRLGSTAAQLINGHLVERSVFLLLVIASGNMFVGAVAGLFLPKETKGAKLRDRLQPLPPKPSFSQTSTGDSSVTVY